MPNWIHARHVEKERALILAKADWISGHGHFPRSGTLFPLPLHSTPLHSFVYDGRASSNRTKEKRWKRHEINGFKVLAPSSRETVRLCFTLFLFLSLSTLLQLLLSPSLFVIILSVFFYISRFNPFSLIEEEEGLFLSSLIRVIPWRPFTPFCLSFSSPFFSSLPSSLFRRRYFTFLQLYITRCNLSCHPSILLLIHAQLFPTPSNA